jgi:hypothetical protein
MKQKAMNKKRNKQNGTPSSNMVFKNVFSCFLFLSIIISRDHLFGHAT